MNLEIHQNPDSSKRSRVTLGEKILTDSLYYSEKDELYISENIRDKSKLESVLHVPITNFPNSLQILLLPLEITEQIFELYFIKKTEESFCLFFDASYFTIDQQTRWKVSDFYSAIENELDRYSKNRI